GIHETLDTDMRKLDGLQVVGRSRTQQMVRSIGPGVEDAVLLTTLGSRLGAQWIIMGSFQRAGSQIRVTPKVFKFPGGEPIPIEKVDGAWDNLFEVQDRVVRVLIKALDLEFQPGRGLSEAPSMDAYEHYGNGRRLMNQMSRDSMIQAIQHFEKAVALD